MTSAGRFIARSSPTRTAGQALGLLKTAGADIVVEGCESVDYSEFQLTVGVLWENSESFNDALLEVLAVEQWLAKMAGRR